MGRFASIQDIEGKLDDFEIQCITDWWGDPVRNILDQSIEKDIFEKYQNGEYCHSLVRLETYITIIILKMLFMKCPPKTTRSSCRKVAVGSPLDLEPFRRKSREDLVKLLNEFRKCFKEDIPNQLMEDLDVIRKLRNAYAHRTTPTQHIFSRNEHKMILKALRETWMDLRNEYDKFVSC